MKLASYLYLLIGLSIGFAGAMWLVGGRAAVASPEKPPKPETHVQWVMKSLMQMQSIHAGMTRAELMKVFTNEGGLYSSVDRTFVYRDCPYFKVNVTFNPAKKQVRNGRPAIIESLEDKIKTISRPYIEWSIMD